MAGGVGEPAGARPFGQVFEQWCPFFLCAGMSAEEYWHGEPRLTRYYMAAEERRRRDQDSLAWSMGAYVYEALLRAAPALNGFSKRGPLPWRERPYSEGAQAREEGRVGSKEAARIMAGIAQRFNDSFG